MLALKIISIILGLLFTLFGYFIYFKKKYTLINGFDESFRLGLKTENYAKRVGLIELTIGIILLIVSILLFIFA